MFKLHRHKSDRLGERMECKFSNLQAFQVRFTTKLRSELRTESCSFIRLSDVIQGYIEKFKVPKGWDKLFLSIISVETGKTVAKSSKALVRSGTCQWTETISESLSVSHGDASKEHGEYQYRIVVSMGSTRSGILGELVLNLSDYLSSKDSGLLALPLKNCNYGTILQLRVQRVTPKSKFRDGRAWRETTSDIKDPNTNNDDMDSKSDGSDNMFNKSAGSSSSSHFGPTSYQDEPGNRETSFSASGSHHSSDSGDSSFGRPMLSPKDSLNGGLYMGKQDSTNSHIGATTGTGSGDLSRSNQSSFNSRASGSSTHTNQWQETAVQTPTTGLSPLSLRASDSSKDLLEAAEETIEELRDEAKMWERHSRKLKLDLEMLKKECSDKSKHQANLDMELSAACTERESLKQEVKQLKSSLEELITKQTDTGTAQIDDMICIQKELEDEVKFQKESNANLTLQLKINQESNIELVSVLQELEETIEKQRLEMAKLSEERHLAKCEEDLRSQRLSDIETEWASKLAVREEEIMKLEEKLSNRLNAQDSSDSLSNGSHPALTKEIEDLKAKVQELERDCAELTDENLELIFNMKEMSKGMKEGKDFHGSLSSEFQGHISSDNSQSEINSLKLRIYELEEQLSRKEMLNEEGTSYTTEPSTIGLKNLEKRCSDLELELQSSKNQINDLQLKLQNSQEEVERKNIELTEVQRKPISPRDIYLGNFDTVSGTGLEKVGSWSSLGKPSMLPELNIQLHLALTYLRGLHNDGRPDVTTECDSDVGFMVPMTTDEVTTKGQAVTMMEKLLELNALLKENFTDCKPSIQLSDVGSKRGSASSVEDHEHLTNDNMIEQEAENLMTEMKSRSEVISKELEKSKSKLDDLEARFALKEQEIDILKHSKSELEDVIANLQKEKGQLEEKLEDVQCDLMVLTNSIDSHVSSNKMLERKSMELESGKHELELHVSELEQENVQLSERISGLEAQLRYLTNEKESNRLELQDSKSLIMDLKSEIQRQQAEMETEKVELKQKLQEAQKLSSEAQEESEYLRRSHSKLQATVESLIEECNSLQILTGDLKRQKLELLERITHLEVDLNDSQNKSFDFYNKVEFLEVKISSLQKDFVTKETSLLSQLESIFQEHKEHEERISQAHNMLKKIESEKTVEVENLKREITHLTGQVSSTNEEQGKTAPDALHELSNLRLEKAKLEGILQEVNIKVKLYETELQTIRQESKNKVQGLVDLLNASKQSEEMLMTDIQHVQRSMDAVKSSEDTFRRMTNELELKLKAFDYEKQQAMEEISELKVQVQKIASLHDEISVLKSSLDDATFEKGKLEQLLQTLSEECQGLKLERVSLTEKVSNMQKALDSGEHDRRSRIALEEKLLRLESDLTAKEASYACETELKNELSRVKRSNSEYQRKIQYLEQEKDELMKKALVMEKDLIVGKEQNQDEKNSSESGSERHVSEHHEMEPHSEEIVKDVQPFNDNQQKRLGDNKLHNNVKRLQASSEFNPESKINVLQTELAEAFEMNNMYKAQLKRFLSEKQASNAAVLKQTASEHDTNNASKILTLEAELKEMKERYLQMSLQYAEVEAQREEMVMKLKSMKKEKRWFS